MPFEIPKLTELMRQSELSINSSLRATSARFTFAKALAYVSAGLSHLLHRHLFYVYEQIFPTKADETSLEEWGIVYGVQRKKPTNAEGRILISGRPGTVIPANTEIRSVDTGEIYLLKSGGGSIAADGSLELNVISKGLGSQVNVQVGAATLTLNNPFPGAISSVKIVQDIAGAADIEPLEAYRDRLLDYIRTPSTGSGIADYIRWAREVPGVSRAWVFPELQGAGTVGVTYEEQGTEYINYSEAVRQKVVQSIELRRPVTARVLVVNPKPTLITLRIAIKPFNATTQQLVLADAKDFFFTRFEPINFRRADGSTVTSTQTVDNLLAILRLRVASRELADLEIKVPAPGTAFQLQTGEVPYVTAASVTLEAKP